MTHRNFSIASRGEEAAVSRAAELVNARAALAASAPELEAALAAKVAAEVAEADRKAPIAATGGGRGGSCA